LKNAVAGEIMKVIDAKFNASGLPHRRLLLCRPQGGLTDILSQIGKACRYADRYNRVVIVQTDFTGAINFRDDFSRYFVSLDKNLVLSAAGLQEIFDQLDVAPKFLSGRVNSYFATLDKKLGNFVENETQEALSFDFGRDYAEPLLVHHAQGGGMRKTRIALRRLALRTDVLDIARARVKKIGSEYVGLHVRNTDYQSDYRERIEKLKREINLPVFVATDDRDVVAFCEDRFRPNRVYSFARLPDQSGQPAHYDKTLVAQDANRDVIADLIMLVLAKDYYFLPIRKADGAGGPAYSGFSLLADMLRKNRKFRAQFTAGDQGKTRYPQILQELKRRLCRFQGIAIDCYFRLIARR
jgi:hypothetical protein